MIQHEKRYLVECQNCDWKEECVSRLEAAQLRDGHENQRADHNAWIIDRQAV